MYKDTGHVMEIIRIFNGFEVRIENSVMRITDLPSDAEQLFRVTEFSFSYILPFDDCT